MGRKKGNHAKRFNYDGFREDGFCVVTVCNERGYGLYNLFFNVVELKAHIKELQKLEVAHG